MVAMLFTGTWSTLRRLFTFALDSRSATASGTYRSSQSRALRSPPFRCGFFHLSDKNNRTTIEVYLLLYSSYTQFVHSETL